MILEFELTPWAMLRPRADSEWEAYTPDLDLYAAGATAQSALQALIDALSATIVADLDAGADPNARRAPERRWEELFEIVGASERLPFEQAMSASAAEASVLAIHFRLRFERAPARLREQEPARLAFLLRAPTTDVLA